ncbi:sugar ABC transporter permease [Parafrigoribacterium mesophilum]|uniref:carbohydrate ABC transporter permease n=1 Tax=Parafrigoribacterium mesophilum TaxID=433646 RepID=UPI003D1545A7
MVASTPTVSVSPRGYHPGGTRLHPKTLTAYLFLAPFLILFGVFVVAPALFGIWISLHNWNPLLPRQPFVGLDNYLQLFTQGSTTSGNFWQSMAATGIFTAASVPFLLVIPLGIAVLLNQKIKGGTVFRAIFFAPYVLGVAVIGVIWKYLLDPQSGVLNHVLALFGLPSNIPWTVDVPWAWISLVGVTVWWTLGLNAVIILAGLKGINADLYDAASMDGAGALRKFFSVTLPGLRPVMVFVTTVTILASANMFGQSYLITQGGPGHQTRTAIMYIADEGLSQFQMGTASAMSYVLFACLAVVSVINFRVQRERSDQ